MAGRPVGVISFSVLFLLTGVTGRSCPRSSRPTSVGGCEISCNEEIGRWRIDYDGVNCIPSEGIEEVDYTQYESYGCVLHNTYLAWFKGEPIGERLGVGSSQDCYEFCSETDGCAAWTLNTNNGWCALKSKEQIKPQPKKGFESQLVWNDCESGRLCLLKDYKWKCPSKNLRALLFDL